MTFEHNLRHWPIVTKTYIEMFDLACQINLPVNRLVTFHLCVLIG